MKRILFIVILALACIGVRAQNKYTAYCDIYLFGERSITKNAVLNFDFGDDKNVDLLDENGKIIKFPSPITAINYLSKKGWKLFSVTSSTNSTMSILNQTTSGIITPIMVMHYIMTKDVSSDAEILNGLRTSKKEKKEKKEKTMSNDGYFY